MVMSNQKCSAQEDISQLCKDIQVLSAQTESLVKLHDRVIKYLLAVVCVIALGRALLDIVNNTVQDKATTEIVSKN